MKVLSACSICVLALLASPTGAWPAASVATNPASHAVPRQATSARGYTAVQADRGKVVYEENCTSCHGASLRGGANEFAAPPLAGPFFLEKWSGRPIEELFRYAAESMPPDRRLPPEAYVDVTAYVLQVGKYPAGETELTADSPMMKRPIERQQ